MRRAQRGGAAAHPFQLAALLTGLAVAGYAASFLIGDPALLRLAVWFVAAAVVHDLLLYPLYSAGDRLLVTLGRGRHRVPVINHVRVPALGAGLTLLMFLPGIIRQGEPTHLAATGLDQQPYLGHWLELVSAMALVSATVYVLRVVLARRRVPDPPEPRRG